MGVKTGEEGPPGPPNTASITLELEKKEKGKGRIYAHVKEKKTGDPIEGAKVTIEGPVERTGKTDEDGTAVFKEVPAPARYDMRATKKGYKSDSGTITEDDWTGTPGE